MPWVEGAIVKGEEKVDAEVLVAIRLNVRDELDELGGATAFDDVWPGGLDVVDS